MQFFLLRITTCLEPLNSTAWEKNVNPEIIPSMFVLYVYCQLTFSVFVQESICRSYNANLLDGHCDHLNICRAIGDWIDDVVWWLFLQNRKSGTLSPNSEPSLLLQNAEVHPKGFVVKNWTNIRTLAINARVNSTLHLGMWWIFVQRKLLWQNSLNWRNFEHQKQFVANQA